MVNFPMYTCSLGKKCHIWFSLSSSSPPLFFYWHAQLNNPYCKSFALTFQIIGLTFHLDLFPYCN